MLNQNHCIAFDVEYLGNQLSQLVTMRCYRRSQHLNKNVFSSHLNHWKLMSGCRSSAGRLFHSYRPAAAKHLSPKLLYAHLTMHVLDVTERSCQRCNLKCRYSTDMCDLITCFCTVTVQQKCLFTVADYMYIFSDLFSFSAELWSWKLASTSCLWPRSWGSGIGLNHVILV